MFTGLIADIGTVVQKKKAGPNWSLQIKTGFDTADIVFGESIAVDGACLTVTDLTADSFFIDASPETLSRTTLGERPVGSKVHLERALRMGDRLGGHLVLGHVDAVGTIKSRTRDQNAILFEVEAPEEVALYLIDKGSVTVDGVSLTVNSVSGARFSLAIIPHTAQHTNLADYQPGRRVNLEADVLGKYVHKFVSGPNSAVTMDTLSRAGFFTQGSSS